GEEEKEIVRADTSAETAPRGVSWDFSKIPLFPPERASRAQPTSPLTATPLTGAMQGKLVFGPTNNPPEREEAAMVASPIAKLPLTAGGVRVHTDEQAVSSTEALDADAYAKGGDIFFGVGRYQPTTPAGRRLLMHEVAHVIQQHNPGPTA